MSTERLSGQLAVAARRHVKERDYWLAQLSGEWQRTTLPYDDPGELAGKAGDTGTLSFRLTAPLSSWLHKLSGGSAHSLHMILAAALTLLLSKYAGQQDIVIGTSIYRQEMDTPFVNTVLPLRSCLLPGMTFKELLLHIRAAIIEANEHYSFPMEILARQLGRPCSPQQDFPLFDAAILLEDVQERDYLRHVSVNLYFAFHTGQDDVIGGRVEYNAGLYRQETVEGAAAHFCRLLEAVRLNMDEPLARVDELTDEERRHMLFDWNRTDDLKPGAETVVQWFHRQTEKTPHRIAVVGKSGSSGGRIPRVVHLSYAELRRRADRLAAGLKAKGVKPDSLVALMLEPSLNMVIGIWGTWKAGGAYLPIAPGYPGKRIVQMLDDSRALFLLSEERLTTGLSYTALRGFEADDPKIWVTAPRQQVEDLDRLQMPNRSLIDYEKYRPYIGQAAAKNSLTLQFSRGCVYKCAFCFKIWPHGYVVRSAENLFEEIETYYKMGIRRFAFVDDLPNLDVRNSSRLYRLIIRNRLKLHLHFPNGVRGDILTKEQIDLMVEAGTVCLDLALETTSPRLQRLIRKNLKLARLFQNMRYIIETYPHVMLETQLLHGIPGETEEEAEASLDFIKSLHWLHFPYIHVLNIYPDSDMARIAQAHGVSRRAIRRSADKAYHELPDTLPFPKSFSREYQMAFLNDYFMRRERLLAVLPFQMRLMTEDELVQKYNSYLPVQIRSFSDLLDYAGIEREEIEGAFLAEDFGVVPDLNRKLRRQFPITPASQGALRLLLLDLSQYFTHQDSIVYDVVEPPLGLLYLLTHLQRTFPGRVQGKIAKSRIDFDCFEQLKTMIHDFDPHLIGVRSLNFYKDFFHRTAALIRQWGVTAPIIAGGPYATSHYRLLLKDRNIDLAVLGEGEVTLAELVGKILENGYSLPRQEVLQTVEGLAFVENRIGSKQAAFNREILFPDRVLEEEAAAAGSQDSVPGNPGDLAYTIYTSGSSGMPKGVLIRHRQLANQIGGLIKSFKLNAALHYLLLTTFTFDVSVMHLCLPLVSGAKLFLIGDEIRKDSGRLWRFIADRKIDLLNIVPAYMEAILQNLEERHIRLKYLFVGGDVFAPTLLRRLRETFDIHRIFNIYGPTETTINAALHQCGDGDEERRRSIPIGKPLKNYRIYVLNRYLRPVPVGAVGELFIAGAGVARGYLNNPELTADKFINLAAKAREDTQSSPHQIPTPKSYILYRTGDLGRCLPNGEIEFLGRSDRQVKIRGFRIEPAEIHRQLLDFPGIREAVVLADKDRGGENYLTAYVVPGSGVSLDSTRLREYLAGELPEYMIPSFFIVLDHLPLTPSGKVDRQALPAADTAAGQAYVAPRDEIETRLTQIWAEVVAVPKDRLGIDANFFKLGGHSLKAAILLSRIQKEFQVSVPLPEIFKRPTIRGLATCIRRAGKTEGVIIRPVEKREYYPCSSAQKRLYVLQQMDETSTAYNLPTAVWLLGDIDPARLQAVGGRLIARHEGFRTAFVLVDDLLVQRIFDRLEGDIESAAASSSPIPTLISQFIRPFDLSRAPLLRLGLFRVEAKRHILILDVHHIVSDAISHAVLVNDFAALYSGRERPRLKLRYRDFSAWMNSPAQAESLKRQQSYWLNRFADGVPVLQLKTSFPRPCQYRFEGDKYLFRVEPALAHNIRRLTSDLGVTLNIFLLAVYFVLLSQQTGQEEMVVGMPVSGRRHLDLGQIVGFFANMLALKASPRKHKIFKEFLQEVKTASLDAYENQGFPFEELVWKLKLKREPGRHPLVDTVFVLHHADDAATAAAAGGAGDIKVEPYDQFEGNITHFDLMLHAVDTGESIRMMFEYSTVLFKPSLIEGLARHYLDILKAVARNGEIRLEDITPQFDILAASSHTLEQEAGEWAL